MYSTHTQCGLYGGLAIQIHVPARYNLYTHDAVSYPAAI